MSARRTFLFMPESAFGPTNNCIGIGNVLLQQGHRVVFAAESSWRGKLAPLGFEEELVDLAPPPEDTGVEADAGQFWKDFVRETAPEFRKPTIEQLDTWVKPPPLPSVHVKSSRYRKPTGPPSKNPRMACGLEETIVAG